VSFRYKTTSEKILDKYPIKNTFWEYDTVNRFIKSFEVFDVNMLDPWNRKFPSEPFKTVMKDDVGLKVDSYLFETTVEGIIMICVVHNYVTYVKK
jgi:hypothetical protein